MSGKVVIFGSGDYARIADVYLTKDSPFEVAAFTVHAERLTERTLRGRDVVPFEELVDRFPPDDFSMLVAIGFSRVNKARAEVYELCKQRGYALISYVNSKAVHWGEFEMGDNCFIFENNVIQPFVTIGNDVVLWSGNHVGHDARIGDHCFVSSHVVVSGRATIGDYTFIGVNATIRDGVTIGPECVIGAGATIIRDAPPRTVFRGPAAEPLRVPSDRLRSI